MTQTNDAERQIETNGRRGHSAYVNVTIYPDIIVATSDGEHITEHQMDKTLKREFPRHSFVFNGFGGDYIRADADRWHNDGV